MFTFRKILTAMMLLLIFLTLCLSSCTRDDGKLKIALSNVYGDMNESNYVKWLRKFNPDAEYIPMNVVPRDSLMIVFRDCSGLVLTGGEDVYPGRYGREADTARCTEISLSRDTLEFLLIEKALKRKIPILGVCRGQQILNVALGGTLYVDVPTEINTTLPHQCEDYTKCFHQVKVLPDNLLSLLSGVRSGEVTTNHHQAVDRVAGDLKVLAVAEDGVIEALGWKDPKNKPFLLTVQWHPERMDTINQLSAPLARIFLETSAKYKH